MPAEGQRVLDLKYREIFFWKLILFDHKNMKEYNWVIRKVDLHTIGAITPLSNNDIWFEVDEICDRLVSRRSKSSCKTHDLHSIDERKISPRKALVCRVDATGFRPGHDC